MNNSPIFEKDDSFYLFFEPLCSKFNEISPLWEIESCQSTMFSDTKLVEQYKFFSYYLKKQVLSRDNILVLLKLKFDASTENNLFFKIETEILDFSKINNESTTLSPDKLLSHHLINNFSSVRFYKEVEDITEKLICLDEHKLIYSDKTISILNNEEIEDYANYLVDKQLNTRNKINSFITKFKESNLDNLYCKIIYTGDFIVLNPSASEYCLYVTFYFDDSNPMVYLEYLSHNISEEGLKLFEDISNLLKNLI